MSNHHSRHTPNKAMSRETVRIPEGQMKQIEALVEAGAFPNKSEAIREGVREVLRKEGRDDV